MRSETSSDIDILCVALVVGLAKLYVGVEMIERVKRTDSRQMAIAVVIMVFSI